MEAHHVDENGKLIKIKDKIIKQCMVRADNWAYIVMVRVAGSSSYLPASEARYHMDLQSKEIEGMRNKKICYNQQA